MLFHSATQSLGNFVTCIITSSAPSGRWPEMTEQEWERYPPVDSTVSSYGQSSILDERLSVVIPIVPHSQNRNVLSQLSKQACFATSQIRIASEQVGPFILVFPIFDFQFSQLSSPLNLLNLHTPEACYSVFSTMGCRTG